MNFFFHACNDFLSSTLTIPKFQNQGKSSEDLNLFSARISNNAWQIIIPDYVEDDFFWTVESDIRNKDDIYFISSPDSIENIHLNNSLLDLNDHTNTMPEYRANLEVSNTKGAWSSYQSEYPFNMTKKLGSLYSECGLLTDHKAENIGVFIRNIYYLPIKDEVTFYLYDDLHNKILSEFILKLNTTSYIDLSDFKELLSNCFIYSKDCLGIPIYVSQYKNGSLSFEHTHPPHESISGSMRFHYVNQLKNAANKKISENYL